MNTIDTIDALEAIYPETPSKAATNKVADRLTPTYRQWIMSSHFCVVSTVGPEGVDGSPRGDDGPVVLEVDEHTLALPDWRGNKRLDTLRNIVRDGRISLMFFVPGAGNVVRVNGTARLTDDAALCARFEHQGKHPRTVTLIAISEVYAQCARAVIRSGLWASGDMSDNLPTIGDIIRDVSNGAFDGEDYDATWAKRAEETMW